jgi:Fuc2NAc and GlcNAc transferase
MVPALAPLTLGLAAASLAASAAGGAIAIRLAHRFGAVDVPNERSSHSVPTPRIGGVPMVAAAALAMACWGYAAAGAIPPGKGLAPALLFALSMACLGFWDDLSGLSPRFRLPIQLSCAGAALWSAGSLFPGIVEGRANSLVLLGSVPAVLWIVWMVNLYNFMDGIDGLAGGQAVVSSSFFFLLFAWHGAPGWAAANIFVAAASAGFLFHNWPPARVFMGDTGSAFLGAFYGIQSVVASAATPVAFPVLVIPFAGFILDTSSTLLRRICRGERWTRAHRSHFYQRLTSVGLSHRRVTLMELAGAAVSCAGAAWFQFSGNAGRSMILAGLLAAYIAGEAWLSRAERRQSGGFGI